MLLRKADFEDIELFIDAQDVPPEQKDILWLWAWSEQPRKQRREIINGVPIVRRGSFQPVRRTALRRPR